MVPVVQLVRASDCGSECRGFESHRAPCKSPESLCFQDFFRLYLYNTPTIPFPSSLKTIFDNMKTSQPTSLLFVCLGNICRSPAAEGIMQHIVDAANLSDKFRIDSAGIGPWHVGNLPDPRMRSHGADHGYDFSTRARQICYDDFSRFDYILVMDRENYHELMSMARTEQDREKVHMMADFATHHPGHTVVPDPYYGGDRGFELVIELLEDACQGLLEHIVKSEEFK